jgi:hypothetical protein
MIWHFPNGSSVRTEGLQGSRSVTRRILGFDRVLIGSSHTLGTPTIVGFENEKLSDSLREGYGMRQPGIGSA